MAKPIWDADFGFAPYGAIGDRIFFDANTNGTEDFTEIGATGVTVNLYIDVNGNGYYDAGTDTFADSDVTDSNGYYLFSALSPTNYVVVVDTNSGQIAGLPLMSDPSSDGVPPGRPMRWMRIASMALRLQPGRTSWAQTSGINRTGCSGTPYGLIQITMGCVK